MKFEDFKHRLSGGLLCGKVVATAMSLIINELLCYMIAKIDSVPTDTLTRLVNENFTDSEVDTAKSLLCDHVDDSIKAGNKRGQHKKKNNLDDIVKMLVQCDRNALPKFVALNLSKLPPISIDCIDVSSLMRKQQLQEVEITNLKELVHDILMVTAETSKRLEGGLPGKPGSDPTAVSTAGDRKADPSPDSSDSPAGVAAAELTPPAPTYSEVVCGGAASTDTREWTTANRKKSAKTPPPRRPAAGAAGQPAGPTPSVPSSGSAGDPQIKARLAAHKTVIGSRTAGPIKAVVAVRRLSMFMSWLPPGTGEEAVKSYVKEQTGADDVTATKLQTRYASYESYRLDIVSPSCDNILDPELWSQGLIVRRFFKRRGSPEDEQGTPAKDAIVPLSDVGN